MPSPKDHRKSSGDKNAFVKVNKIISFRIPFVEVDVEN